jgi:hypothetical protein
VLSWTFWRLVVRKAGNREHHVRWTWSGVGRLSTETLLVKSIIFEVPFVVGVSVGDVYQVVHDADSCSQNMVKFENKGTATVSAEVYAGLVYTTREDTAG